MKLRKQITSAGTDLIAWRCMACNRWAENPIKWLRHDYVSEIMERYQRTIEHIIAIADYSDQTPCVICGEPGQLHHWAPQAYAEYFGPEWIKWPTEYLCDRHHKLWHVKVTPTLTTWRVLEKERAYG